MVKIIVGQNDLFTSNPELKLEWDFEKNIISNECVTAGSHKKVWWLCKNGHSWQAEIKSRVNGANCPYCSGRLAIVGLNDLATLYPELIKEWNYEKNINISPTDFKVSSNVKVWWKCANGHEWISSIDKRTRLSRGCPYCANQKVLKGFNDLQTLYPNLALEWNYQKNKGITPDSVIAKTGKKYLWICNKGHEWEATVNSRIRGNGCSQCSKERATSFPEQAVFYYIKKLFCDAINGYYDNNITELDIYVPSLNSAIEYDGQFYHQSKERDDKKTKIVTEAGIKLYRIKENSKLDYKFADFLVENTSIYYNPSKLSSLNSVITHIINMLGGNADDVNIDVQRDRIEIWNQYIIMEKENSLESISPKLSSEWNIEKNRLLTPAMVSHKSGKKVWWKCKNCGYEWEAVISHRLNGTDCPVCATNKISMKVSKLKTGVTDLETMFPNIANEWHKTKNGDLKPSEIYCYSKQPVWWKCNICGNEYSTSVVNRTKHNSKCRKCLYVTEENNLKSNNPDLMEEWDFSKNNEIDPTFVSSGSAKKVWWKCKICGYEWQSRISHRTNGTGCPKCKKRIKY